MTTQEWLDEAYSQLERAGIPSARLDADLILSHTLLKPRIHLHAHGDDTLSPSHQEIADARLSLRLDRVPVAYIIGHKYFYGRSFEVSPSVLIPRPESETIIELVKDLPTDSLSSLVDVGTGSGCLGITLKLEIPDLEVDLLDYSESALSVASKNAKRLSADVNLLKSDLLADYSKSADIIVANLPYVDTSWQRSPETDHEPALALFAADRGLELIYTLIDQAASKQKTSSYLVLEADPVQHDDIVTKAADSGFELIKKQDYIVVLSKI